MFRDKINLRLQKGGFCRTPSNPPVYGPVSGIVLGIIGEGKRIANLKFQKHIMLILTDNFVPVHIPFLAMVTNIISLTSVRITLALLLITCFCKMNFCLYLEK